MTPEKPALQIEFRVDGGLAAFPGLAKPVRIDCAVLPAGEAARLRELVRKSDFFAAPQPAGAPAMPDARAYTIAIDDGLQCRTLTLAEPIADAPMRELVAALRLRASAIRQRGAGR
jgi:hypothetical protein